MDSDYIQQTRSKLQRRLKRLTTAGSLSFHWTLLLTWRFLQENQITKGILDDLERRFPNADARADEVWGGRAKLGETESNHVALCHALLKRCASSPCYDYLRTLGPGLVKLRPNLVEQVADEKYVEAFCKTYVEVLFDYLDEEINDKRMTLFLIKKFKHRCEWFCRDEMLTKWKENTKTGESLLARDFYKYLHDQGIEFQIGPHSASGEVDLLSSQVGNDRLVADAKIFDPRGGRGIGYIAKGYRQIYEYTKDHNEPFGFLVIFKTCEEDLSVAMSGQEAAIPFFTHNHKTIFFIVIDICHYQESASKRGKLKKWELTAESLVQALASAEARIVGKALKPHIAKSQS